MTAKARDTKTGRMTVVALTSSPCLDEAIDLARYARDVGADVIKLTVPYAWAPGVAATKISGQSPNFSEEGLLDVRFSHRTFRPR